MYERSAIVLEKFMDKVLELDKEYNLKKNIDDYNNLVTKINDFQTLEEKDVKIIQDFDDTVRKIEYIQREQKKIFKDNKKIEDTRAQLFSDLGEDAKVLDEKIKKTEDILDRNNDRLKELREDFIDNLKDFSKKQKDRNKCDKKRRETESEYIDYVKNTHEKFDKLDIKDMAILKDFISSEKEQLKEQVLNIMTKNGKNERIPFNQDILKKAINNRMDIAEKEAECYIVGYEKMKKLLIATDGENIKLNRYEKTLRDITVKLEFLKAQKEYIVGFLDYERMTTISGARAHKKMMIDACNNFELDMIQIKKLYELLLKEIENKATESDYNELYNKNYLKNIEDKERNFEKAANNVDITMGTLINSNYWRIDGIKNIYMVFKKEISEKFNKNLSKYEVEEEQNTEYDDEYDDIDLYDDYEDEYYNDDIYEDDYEDEDEEEAIYSYYDKYEDDYEDDEDIYEYKYTEEDNDKEGFNIEDIDKLIKSSRKKGLQEERKANKKDNKGLLNKFFKK